MSAEEKKGKKSPPPRISSYAVKVEEKTAEFEKKLELLQESQNEKSKLENHHQLPHHGINSCSQLILCTELLKEGRLP